MTPAAMQRGDDRCDVFIIHSEEDAGFVSGFLRPALESAGATVRTHADHELGRIRIDEAERAIDQSRVTLLVVSPASEHDRWASFEMKLARSASVLSSEPGSGQEMRVVPLLLATSRSSSRFEQHVHLDFRSRVAADWEVQVARLCRELRLAVPAPVRRPSPFVGEKAFAEGDARWFRGRRRELELISRLLEGGARELHILGASGSGKSSLIQASVLPALRANAERRSSIRQLTPGPHPEARLIELLGGGASIGEALRELLRREKTERLVLVVDPMEAWLEAGTMRQGLLSALRALREDGRCAVVGALRTSHVALLAGMQRGERPAAQVNLDESPAPLREIIEEPAREAGLHIEAGLVERLLSDLRDAPGALALLQLVLGELHQRGRLGLITLHDYEDSADSGGGLLMEVLTRQVARLRASLDEAQRDTVGELLLRLFTSSETGFSCEERSLEELRLAAGGGAEHLLWLTTARLITVGWSATRGEAVARPAHALLALAWPQLADQLRERQRRQRRRARSFRRLRVAWGTAFSLVAMMITLFRLYGAPDPHVAQNATALAPAMTRPLRATPQREGNPVVDMVAFAAATLRPGVYAAGRPRECATREERELHCVADEPERIPAVPLPSFELDAREVTNRSFAAWLRDSESRWELTHHEVARLRVPPHLPLVWAGPACGGGLLTRGAEIVAAADKVDWPVTCVTWYGASLYCEHLGKRLPSEHEWERAAKGTEGRPFPWGRATPALDGVAILRRGADAGGTPSPVGTSWQDRTPEGVYDLGGNVAEWVESGRNTGEQKVVRGGHWGSDSSCGALVSRCERQPIVHQAAATDEPLFDNAFVYNESVGFRCARSVERAPGDREAP